MCLPDSVVAVQVIGGAILHQRRRSRSQPCKGNFVSLDIACGDATVTVAATATNAPFGFDPVAIQQSSMFQADYERHASQYYNTTTGSPDWHLSGLPMGFFSRPVPNYAEGFPIIFQVSARFLCLPPAEM